MPIGAAPVLVAPRVSGERSLLLSNVGTVAIYLGWNSGVSAASGYELRPSGDVVLGIREAVYAIAPLDGGSLSFMDDTG